MTLPLRIMTKDFKLIAEITQYASLQLTRSWHGVGSVVLKINRYLKHANELQRGRIIFPHNKLNKAYIIRHREIELDENGKATENWIIQALALKSWMGQRITYPPLSAGYDSTQGNAESVMLHYINNNIINPSDPQRKMNRISVATNQERGPSVNWQSRYKNLAEEISEISRISGLGWNIDVDTIQEEYLFRVQEGRNLAVNQSHLPPAIFSPEFSTLGKMTYTESELNFRNVAVVGGQGENVDRRIVEVGSTSGYERYELFVDARDVSDEEDVHDTPTQGPDINVDEYLAAKGQQALTDYTQEFYLEGQALTHSKLVYEEDYDLGDIVTLQNKEWGVTLNAQITEVKEIYEPGNTSIELTFGNNRPTLISRIKQELANLREEITR
ncbi:siphovirus ReqiPepy6 Gp37-like family protein [Paenibacillus urinalis]|uniref:Siphovirus ReqiPepy6 Gp37-like family protein n=1 Tax=Paenibacillus urinalis TaxID=521520 RepID=A0AAX3MXE1_9BACL|nr:MULTISPECIES: siphovirus ReqiPepy6 Gp37-like family protein [Paenibacillus]WDH81120.1 siphovirus ReqiPepy6 Gp37-like family protein [Paenibacillus urinalis]WDH97173.1 siphovirus ReqiPepy6 Gp37-like family protein [Paenibacillus urinalis]WDI00835.1 siphovirus ReqiPepy6 Gp37-like family protein [Paenibacillus urinalis]